MKDYAKYYENLTTFIRKSPGVLSFLVIYNGSVTKLMYLLYPLLLVYIAWNSLELLLTYVVIPGLSFLLVSLVRKLLNQARPYESWNISPLLEKDTSGQSMPSRHVFSATIISMCFLSINTCLGVVLLTLSTTLAVCRVLGGVHYTKDVLIGMLIGILVGSLLFI